MGDDELRREVEQALAWEPSIDERTIGVAVLDGIVTLAGEARSYAEKWRAERTVERVKGVRAVVNNIQVKTPGDISDIDIAKAAVEAIKWNVLVPSDKIKVRVENAWITMTGEVNWDYQRRAAEKAVRDLPGVRGITDLIAVRPKVDAKVVKEKIEEELKRAAALDAQNIVVEVNGSEVILRGTVRSAADRHEAEKAAWAAPGVTDVQNFIKVEEMAA
jgi:osmotically-inducible protein OsmY